MINIKEQELFFSWTNNELSEFQKQKIYQRCAFRFKGCYIHWFITNKFSLTITYSSKSPELDELLFDRVIKFVLKIMKEYKYENPKWIKSPA